MEVLSFLCAILAYENYSVRVSLYPRYESFLFLFLVNLNPFG